MSEKWAIRLAKYGTSILVTLVTALIAWGLYTVTGWPLWLFVIAWIGGNANGRFMQRAESDA